MNLISENRREHNSVAMMVIVRLTEICIAVRMSIDHNFPHRLNNGFESFGIECVGNY